MKFLLILFFLSLIMTFDVVAGINEFCQGDDCYRVDKGFKFNIRNFQQLIVSFR